MVADKAEKPKPVGQSLEEVAASYEMPGIGMVYIGMDGREYNSPWDCLEANLDFFSRPSVQTTARKPAVPVVNGNTPTAPKNPTKGI